MKPFRWNHDKNEALKVERGISFEVIALAIEADGLLDELRHPNTEKYPNQSVLVVAFDNYVYLQKTLPYAKGMSYRNQPTDELTAKMIQLSKDGGYKGWYGIELLKKYLLNAG